MTTQLESGLHGADCRTDIFQKSNTTHFLLASFSRQPEIRYLSQREEEVAAEQQLAVLTAASQPVWSISAE